MRLTCFLKFAEAALGVGRRSHQVGSARVSHCACVRRLPGEYYQKVVQTQQRGSRKDWWFLSRRRQLSFNKHLVSVYFKNRILRRILDISSSFLREHTIERPVQLALFFPRASLIDLLRQNSNPKLARLISRRL